MEGGLYRKYKKQVSLMAGLRIKRSLKKNGWLINHRARCTQLCIDQTSKEFFQCDTIRPDGDDSWRISHPWIGASCAVWLHQVNNRLFITSNQINMIWEGLGDVTFVTVRVKAVFRVHRKCLSEYNCTTDRPLWWEEVFVFLPSE